MHREHLLGIGIALSVIAHGALGLALSRAPKAPPPPPAPSTVRVDVVEPSPAPPPDPEQKPDPEPEPEVVERARPVRTAPEPEPEPEPAAEPEAQPGPVDLSGVTLTNEGSGAGWSAPTGNGRARNGPLRTPRAPARPVVPAASTQPVVKGPPVVSPADLSRPPAPPALAGVLRGLYPPDARRRGLEGQASVRARIGPSGRVESCSVVMETAAGFGQACRSAVLGSVWSPPLDGRGQPVATYVRYTCRFRIDR